MRPIFIRSIVVLALLIPPGLWRWTRSGSGGMPPATTRIESVYDNGDQLLAATVDGMFVADRSERVWRPVGTPSRMPRGGHFGHGPKSASAIYYHSYPHLRRGTWAITQPGEWAGVWRSDDGGRNWAYVSDQVFDDMLVLSNGVVCGARISGAVMMSKDRGQSWRGIGSFGLLGGRPLFEDPEHPGLACVTLGSRAYVAHAEDERYQWNSERESDYWRSHRVTIEQSDGVYFVQSTAWELRATLENYFRFAFGDRVEICPFDIVPDKASYEFAMRGPKTVGVRVEFHVAAMETLLDQEQAVAFYGLEISDPPPPQMSREQEIDLVLDRVREGDGRVARELAAEAPLAHRVSEGTAYSREIDLDRLHQWDKPGLYRVRLIYSAMAPAPGGAKCWLGSFSGQWFLVRIRE